MRLLRCQGEPLTATEGPTGFSKYLEQQTIIPSAPPGPVAMEAAPQVAAPLNESQRARLRVEGFLKQQKAKATLGRNRPR